MIYETLTSHTLLLYIKELNTEIYLINSARLLSADLSRDFEFTIKLVRHATIILSSSKIVIL